jgi:hypothetical protein
MFEFLKKVTTTPERQNPLPPPPPQWSKSFDVGPLRQRLAGLDNTDALLPLLLGFLDAQIVAQAESRVSPELAQQVIGRANMCADLKLEILRLWREAHLPPKAPKK